MSFFSILAKSKQLNKKKQLLYGGLFSFLLRCSQKALKSFEYTRQSNNTSVLQLKWRKSFQIRWYTASAQNSLCLSDGNKDLGLVFFWLWLTPWSRLSWLSNDGSSVANVQRRPSRTVEPTAEAFECHFFFFEKWRVVVGGDWRTGRRVFVPVSHRHTETFILFAAQIW